MKGPVRILLIDDRVIVRAGLRALLHGDGVEIVGEIDVGSEALAGARTLAPDVIAANPLTLPPELMQQVAAAGFDILAVLACRDDAGVLSVLQSGASGFITLAASRADILEALRTVARGYAYLDGPAKALLLQAFRTAGSARDDTTELSGLSQRETEVLTLIARGYDTAEIGDRLSLSRKTVDTYRSRLMHKLTAHHRWQLVELAIRASLLSVETVPPVPHPTSGGS